MDLFENYPARTRYQLAQLKRWIKDLAQEKQLGRVTESIKWGQASYSVKNGSPIRLGWSEKTPNYVSIYFHCQSRLVSTFRELYPNELEYVGNREIRLAVDTPLPEAVLKHCIEMALKYHTIKHLPLLGN